MPLRLEGSCRCGAVRFALDSHTPCPYQLCYCSICRRTAGGGYAVNLGGLAASLQVEDRAAVRVFRAPVGAMGHPSSAERNFCGDCGTALWLYDLTWPDLIHPHASAVDTALPEPPSRVHIFLADKPGWVRAEIRDGDACFDGYPELSLAEWHRAHGHWVD